MLKPWQSTRISNLINDEVFTSVRNELVRMRNYLSGFRRYYKGKKLEGLERAIELIDYRVKELEKENENG